MGGRRRVRRRKEKRRRRSNMTNVRARDTKEENGIICVMDRAWRQEILESGSDIVSNDEGRVHDT